MGESNQGRALEAFRRLLTEAAAGGQPKVDALVALSQRTVFVVTWTSGGDDYRSLVNSGGQNALPLFTDLDQLEDATKRFGWSSPDGDTPYKEIGAREALRHTMAHELGFVVVDITSPHALEIERAEIEPLLRSANRSDSSGPFAGVGRISENMLQAAKPASPSSMAPPRDLPAGALEPKAKRPSVRPAPIEVLRLPESPADALLDALTEVLRGYPEVEWAAFCTTRRPPSGALPTVGLRVDTAYRARVAEIVKALRETADANGASVDVLLLDDAALVRAVRADSLVFFPWRRRTGG